MLETHSDFNDAFEKNGQKAFRLQKKLWLAGLAETQLFFLKALGVNFHMNPQREDISFFFKF